MASRFEALARTALLETTPAANVGDWVAEEVRPESGEGVEIVDVVFANEQSGYLGWAWVVTVAAVGEDEPTVLELGLIPGDGALLAPEWIPWSVRLADWQAQQQLLADTAVESGEGEDDPAESDDDDDDADDDDDEPEGDSDDDVLDDDEDDEDEEDDDSDEDGPRVTHGGDIDGVDIDDLDDLG